MNKKEFINEIFNNNIAKQVHRDRYLVYNYSKAIFIDSNTEIEIVCTKHGSFFQTPKDHLKGSVCPRCIRKKSITSEDIIEKAIKFYGDIYDYSKLTYLDSSSKVEIICKLHGSFFQKANYHLKGYGCPTCNPRGYTKTFFKNHCIKNNNGLGIFYIIRCFNDSESFYKAGITSMSIEARYAGNVKMPYNYEVIYSKENDPISIYNFEIDFLKRFKTQKYKPNIYFGGVTECLIGTIDISDYLEA